VAAGTADSANKVVPCSESSINLKFFSRRVCQFKVQGQSKRLEVLLFNQNYNPQSTFETLKSNGLTSIIPSFESIASMRGLSVCVFLVFCLMLLMSNSLCGDYNAAATAAAEAATAKQSIHRAYEYQEGEVPDEIETKNEEAATASAIVSDGSWRETFCNNQESVVVQLAILVIVMTAIRMIMTKG